ncbi:MAG: penicillin acylase family protein [Blastocatellia bacterium]
MHLLTFILLFTMNLWQDEIRVRIETELGPIVVTVDAKRAPATAANFLRYVDGAHYDGGRFHRTVTTRPDNQPVSPVKIDVIQGGVAPAREKSGFAPIPLERTSMTGLRHLDGVISMARLGPDTATSDFFICVGAQPELDFGGKRNPDGQGFAAFGRVVEGMEIVRKIHHSPVREQSLTPPIAIGKVRRVDGNLAGQVTIYRDKFGVPHIFGKTDAATIFGLMYAQSEDNFWQLEQDLLRATGRAAESIGEKGVDSDRIYRAFEVERLSKEEYEKLPAPLKVLCDAYAAGINHYIAGKLAGKTRLPGRVEPWFILATSRMGRLGGLNRVGIPAPALRVGESVGATAQAMKLPEEPPFDLDEGSNMWAIGPSRSSSGRAMLLINPHVGFFGGGQRYEAHLNSEEGLNVYGFAILGTPYIRSGFTPVLGWSHTNNYADTVDGYVETFDRPEEPLAYRYGTGYRMAVEWEDVIRVKTASGVETRRFRFRKTHHGPIVGALDGRPVAARIARMEDGGELAQRFAMNRARNFAEFRSALARVALSGSNTIYADQTGKIFYVHGNAMPKRASGYDWTMPVDGRLVATEWQGYHKLDELPNRLNPPSGYLQNCNSTPFLMTGRGNPDRGKYPEYMVPEEDTARARSSRRILEGRRKFNFDEWTVAATDTTVEEAGKGIEGLTAEWEVLKREDEARAEQIKPALLELKAWDRVARVDSVPSTVFLLWFEKMRNGQGSDLGIILRGEGRSGQEAGEKFRQIRALEEVVASLQRDYNDWHVPWGEINRLQRVFTSGDVPFNDNDPSYPVAGGPGTAGMVFTFNARPEKGQVRRYGISGNSFVAVVEFGKQLRARSILVFGQTGDPRSNHFVDQAELYASGRFKPVSFTLAEIRANLEREYQP